MTTFDLYIRFPRGAVLVGGHGAAKEGTVRAHAQSDGQPRLPSSALRGALRMSLESLFRAVDEPVCEAGLPGGVPKHNRKAEPNGDDAAFTTFTTGACGRAPETRCPVCKIFGYSGAAMPKGAMRYSGLVLSDAVLENGQDNVQPTVRPSNAVNRARRSVEENHLFAEEILALAPSLDEWTGDGPPTGPYFRAQVRLKAPYPNATEADEKELEAHFRAAVRATTHLGASRSRGLGRVDMRLGPPQKKKTRKDKVVVKNGTARFRMRLKSTTCLGTTITHSNVVDTRTEILGSTLRGALGFHWYETLGDKQRKIIDALTWKGDPDKGQGDGKPTESAVFDVAYLVDKQEDNGWAAPRPLTARACKIEGKKHGVVDVFFERVLEKLEQKVPAKLRHEQCPECGEPLKALKGPRKLDDPHVVVTRSLTRTALNRKSDSVRERALFTQMLLQPPGKKDWWFEATVRRIPKEAKPLFETHFPKEITVGRGRSRGWGQVEIEPMPPPKVTPLAERIRKYIAFLKTHGIKKTLERIVPITLLSPLMIEAPDDSALFPGWDAIQKVWDKSSKAKASRILAVRRFAEEGVWDERKAKNKAQRTKNLRRQSVVAGSVYAFEVAAALDSPEVITALETLELNGAGDRTWQGFGRVLCFDPHLFLQGG